MRRKTGHEQAAKVVFRETMHDTIIHTKPFHYDCYISDF